MQRMLRNQNEAIQYITALVTVHSLKMTIYLRIKNT